MSVRNLNQNRHLYVGNVFADNVATITENSLIGTIGVKVIDDGVDKEFYFKVRGADGVLKSDRIQLKNLNYVKVVDASEMVTPLKSVLVSLDPSVNEGLPVAGQDYILRIALRQFYGMSDADQYFKDAAVHAVSGMTAAQFYEKLAESLNLSFSREVGATKESNPYLTFKGDANGLTITEKEQAWTRGIQCQERVYFEVFPLTIYTGGEDVIWGKVEDKTPSKGSAIVGTTGIGNGKEIADLEWFCMGERGDQYREIGYPNYIPTTYLVDPTQQYHVLELHFGFTDTGVNSYRSEKDITIVSTQRSVLESLAAAMGIILAPGSKKAPANSADDDSVDVEDAPAPSEGGSESEVKDQ